MSRELTKREKGFVKDYAMTGNGTLSAKRNYVTKNDNVAAVTATRTLRKDKIQKAIKSIAEQIPNSLLKKVHLEGLRATKRSGTGGMKIGLGADGSIEDVGHTEIDEPDFAVRHKYLDTAYKLKNLYPKEGGNTAIQINIKNILDKIEEENG